MYRLQFIEPGVPKGCRAAEVPEKPVCASESPSAEPDVKKKDRQGPKEVFGGISCLFFFFLHSRGTIAILGWGTDGPA